MSYKAAVVQAGSVPFHTEQTVDKACALIAEASREGARLIVFPEAFVSGYPKGCHFGAPVGYRTPEGREDFFRYQAGAIVVPGPETDRLGEAAREADAFVVIGVMERDAGTLYCTVVFLGSDGKLQGKHRKLMPTVSERVIWGFGDGSTLPVFDTDLGKIGSVICWENYMPAMRMAMYGKGINIYCAPTADDRDVWLASMQHIAQEGRCFVFSACQYIKRSAYEADYRCALGDDPEVVLMRGNSVIVDPMGRIVAGPYVDGETILYADIDLDLIAHTKFEFDVVGHYARPDIFTLAVNEKAMAPVQYLNDTGSEA